MGLYGHIEDFLFSQKVSDKTRSNIKSCLHSFFKWVSKREGVPVPEFPETNFELGWRNIIDIDTQRKVIEEVKRLTYEINPNVWFGVHCLATYIAVRPCELMSVREAHINLKLGGIVIPHPKEKRPKIVYLLAEDIEFIRSLPKGLPDLYFFRHLPGRSGVAAGAKFGPRYLYKWWKKACDNLGVEGVDLYGGTRHSTATALGQICTPEEVKDATGHVSEAFERYFQGRQARALNVTKKIRRLDSNQGLIKVSGGDEKGKLLKFKE
jgi:integrase